MNLFGKILVVGILVMSILFMGVAMMVWSVNRNYLEANTALKARQTQLQSQVNQLQSEKTNLTQQLAVEQNDKARSLARLQNEVVRLSQNVAELEAQRVSNANQAQQAVAAMNAAQQSLNQLTAETQTLRQQLNQSQADRDQVFAQLVELTDASNQLMALRDTLQSTQLDLLEKIAGQTAVLEMHNLPNTPDGPARVEGEVATVRNDYVEVSIGRDDGLRIGDTLEVYRGDQYLGRIQIERIEPDKAVAKILRNLQRGYIQRGDNVTTQLKVG